jgi:hypothetical protein
LLGLDRSAAFSLDYRANSVVTQADLADAKQILSRVTETVAGCFATTHLANAWTVTMFGNAQPCVCRRHHARS